MRTRRLWRSMSRALELCSQCGEYVAGVLWRVVELVKVWWGWWA